VSRQERRHRGCVIVRSHEAREVTGLHDARERLANATMSCDDLDTVEDHDLVVAEQIGFFAKPKLLIVDELGYLPFEKRSANLFFLLITRRYERGSMLLTTNQMVTQWGQVFGDEMIAAAVLDRLLHHSHVLVVQGESYRLKQKKRAGLVARSAG